MAIDNTTLIVESGGATITEVIQILNALKELSTLDTWTQAIFDQTSPSEDFTDYETDIQVGCPHMDGEKLNDLYDVIMPALNTFLTTTTLASGTYAGKTYMEMFNLIVNIC